MTELRDYQKETVNRLTNRDFEESFVGWESGFVGIDFDAYGTIVIDSWVASASAQAGLTVAHSQVISALSGSPMHQMTFGGSYTLTGQSVPGYGVYGRLQQNVDTTFLPKIVAGDKLETLVEFEIDAGSAEIAFPHAEMRWKSNSLYNADMSPKFATNNTDGSLPNEAIRGVLRVPYHLYVPADLPLAAAELSINLYGRLSSGNGTFNPVGNLRFGRAVVQKYID